MIGCKYPMNFTNNIDLQYICFENHHNLIDLTNNINLTSLTLNYENFRTPQFTNHKSVSPKTLEIFYKFPVKEFVSLSGLVIEGPPKILLPNHKVKTE